MSDHFANGVYLIEVIHTETFTSKDGRKFFRIETRVLDGTVYDCPPGTGRSVLLPLAPRASGPGRLSHFLATAFGRRYAELSREELRAAADPEVDPLAGTVLLMTVRVKTSARGRRYIEPSFRRPDVVPDGLVPHHPQLIRERAHFARRVGLPTILPPSAGMAVMATNWVPLWRRPDPFVNVAPTDESALFE